MKADRKLSLSPLERDDMASVHVSLPHRNAQHAQQVLSIRPFTGHDIKADHFWPAVLAWPAYQDGYWTIPIMQR